MSKKPSTKSWSQSDPCPCCQKPLAVSGLTCDDCGLSISGPIAPNEFTLLSSEDLHLLRIFLRSEGKIRDMESPLGLSYPTLRARISELNLKLQRLQGDLGRALGQTDGESPKEEPEILSAAQILARLAKHEISFDESIKLITNAHQRRKK